MGSHSFIIQQRAGNRGVVPSVVAVMLNRRRDEKQNEETFSEEQAVSDGAKQAYGPSRKSQSVETLWEGQSGQHWVGKKVSGWILCTNLMAAL